MITTTQLDIEKTYKVISPEIIKTPLLYSPKLSDISGAKVYLKLENQQRSGSFKIRGVLSKLYSLNTSDFDKVFVAASTGNHAVAFCDASEKFGFKGMLFLPENTSPSKLRAIEPYMNVEKIFFGKSSVETEAKATNYAQVHNGVLIHPYNDPKIIEGQGSIGLEIRQQLPEIDTVLAPIGGGGLVAGLCTYFSNTPQVNVIGCQPENASEMYQSVKANTIVPTSTKTTIADAVAGGIEDNALTFEIIKNSISGFEIINEEAMQKAVAFIMTYHQILIEPTAALPVAALLKSKAYRGKNVVLVLTGKRVSTQIIKEIMNRYGNNYS